METNKTLKISNEMHKELDIIRANLGLKTFDEVLKHLLLLSKPLIRFNEKNLEKIKIRKE